MSIEEILELKEKIGSKMFNQELGLSKRTSYKDKFKRENKNRPRMEPISKRPVRLKRAIDVVGVKAENKRDVRDPRFDPLCGQFDDGIFKDSYKFVDEIKVKELSTLKKELQTEEDPERIEQIKYLVQRIVSFLFSKKLFQKSFKNLFF
jgi:ribosomal RNA-processing protein 36